MTTKTETYILGMQAINNFYSMLYAAMRESMPEAQISQTGAYVWQGYQIDQYKELAYGQYYCQIYPGDAKTLVFKEGYQDASHKASDFEKQHRIMQGRYYYPFYEGLNLIRTRFFDYNTTEQFFVLRSFVSGAAERALIWQNSEAREKVTGSKFLKGKLHREKFVHVPSVYEQVGREFLQAWEFQKSLISKLENVLKLFPDIEDLEPNSSVYHFGVRGLRLKFNSAKLSSRWSIYFNDFERLKYEIPKVRKNSYNLIENGFFDLSSDEQTRHLTDFAQASLGMTI